MGEVLKDRVLRLKGLVVSNSFLLLVIRIFMEVLVSLKIVLSELVLKHSCHYHVDS